jgi:autotransporter-associated beta strand protein
LFGVLQLGNAGGRSDQTVAGLYGADYHSSVVGGYEAILPDADSRLTVMMSAGSQDTYYGSFGGTEGAEGKLAVVLQSTPQFVTEFDLIGGGNYDGGTTVASVQFFPAGADDVGTGPVTLDNGSLWLLEGTLANEIVADANTQDGIVELAPSGLTIAGDLSGSGEIDTSGNMFALSGDNSGFTGTFYQAGGTTTYLTSPSAGSAGATWWIDGGTLAADLSSNPTNQPIELGALKGTVPRYYGTVTNVGIPVTFEVGANGQSTQFRGVIADGSGSSTVALTKVGAGTLTLTGASTYSGGTTVENGTLALAGGDNRLPVGTFVVLGDDQGDSGVLQLGDGTTACNQTLAGLYLAGGSASRAVGGATAVGTLTVAPPADSTDEYDGLLGGSGTNENDLALTKVGPASRLTLTGANTYSGVTTIVSGTLDIANTTAINTMLNSTLSAGVNDTGGFLIFDYSGGTDPNATVLTLLTAAYNGGVNSFLSGQIRDSSATTLIGLGWVDNTTTMQITIMPAIYGDVNLDGVVNFSDLNKVLTNYNLTGMVWSQGDVNYNGVVNFSDLNKVLTNYNLTGPLNIQDAP